MPGVFVSSGMDLRLSNISINLDTGEASPVSVDVRLDTWNHWLLIARHARDDAKTALGKVLEAHAANDDNALGTALEAEFRNGMVSIAATAFAIDAFYASVKERQQPHPSTPEWQAKRLARCGKIGLASALLFADVRRAGHVCVRQPGQWCWR